MPETNLSLGQKSRQETNRSKVQPLLKMLTGAGVCAAMVGGSYWALQPKVSDGLLPGAVKLLPENTVAVIGLTLDSAQVQRLGSVGNPQSRQVIQKRWTAWQQEFLVGYQLEKDIQPWLNGEIYLAYLNTDRTEKLLLLPMRAGSKAAEIIEKLKAKIPLKERQFQGITIWEAATSSPALAVVDSFVVLSDRASVLEKAIQASKSGKNLGGQADYQQARSAIAVANPLVRGYFNLALATTGSKMTNRSQLRQGLAVNGTLEGNTLAWRGASWGKARTRATASPSLTLGQKLPQKSLWAVMGSDLGEFWQFYQPLATNNPLAPVPAETIVKSLKSAVGLDISRDILSWSQGEFAIALAPQNQAEKIPVGGGLLLLATSKNRQATDTMLSGLDKTMADRYRYEVKKIDRETQWLTTVGGVAASHGWLGENVAFLSLGKTDRTGATLVDRAEFQQLTSSNIPNPTGRFFMDLKAMQVSGNLTLEGLPVETRAVLSAVREVGMTTASEATVDRFDLIFKLESVADNAPSPSQNP
jgi:Protein of unknown function (DUF3352)